MWRGSLLLCLVWLWMAPGVVRAQDDESGNPTNGIPRGSFRGVSWGFTRTWWSRSPSDEGYPQAGTAGPSIGLRLWRPMGARTGITPYIQYFWMDATRTTLLCDSCGATRTDRMAFRELDLGINFDYSLAPSGHGVYLGAGPSVRWGQSGQREVGANRSGLRQKATWFGVTLLAGYRVPMGNKALVFFEPQLMVSPDLADRWQDTYPPDNLNLIMGILW
jgi:hypothetical protein